MPDTLTPLTAALHAELCRQHDVKPEGHSMGGDFAALRDDAAKFAEVTRPHIDAAWEEGRKHGLKQLEAILEAVNRVHGTYRAGPDGTEYCTGCGWAHPCPTRKAIAGE